MEELRGEGTSCQGVIVQSFCVPPLPPCPLRLILRAVGPDSHRHPSPNLPSRQGIYSMASEMFQGMRSRGKVGTGEPSSEPSDPWPVPSLLALLASWYSQ